MPYGCFVCTCVSSGLHFVHFIKLFYMLHASLAATGKRAGILSIYASDDEYPESISSVIVGSQLSGLVVVNPAA